MRFFAKWKVKGHKPRHLCELEQATPPQAEEILWSRIFYDVVNPRGINPSGGNKL